MSRRYPSGYIRPGYNPLEVPDAPTSASATAGNQAATVSFTAPSDTGGSAVTAYYATSTPGQITGTALSSPVTVTGLSNGTEYTFQIWAENSYGPSAYSEATGPVTPNVVFYLATLYAGTGSGVATDSSGNVYVSGLESSTNYRTYAKYNEAGVLQWKKRSNLSSGNTSRLVTDSSGNLITTIPTSGSIQVQKLASDGNSIVWQKYVIGWGTGCSGVNTALTSVAIDPSGNIYVAAPVYQACDYGFTIFKLNSSGSMQWSRRVLTGFQGDESVGCAADSSGNVYAVCGSASTSYRGYLVKYNTSGSRQWDRIAYTSTSYPTYYRDVKVDSLGYVYVTGYTSSAGAIRKIIVAKYDSSGTKIWARDLEAGSDDIQGYGIAIDSQDNVYVCGTWVSTTYIMVMAKWNSDGVIQWQRQLSNASRKAYGYSVAIDANDDPVFMGYSTNTSNADNQYLTAKVPADGSLTGTYTLNGIAFTYAASSFSDVNSGAGFTNGSGANNNLALTANNDTNTLSTSSMTSAVTTL